MCDYVPQVSSRKTWPVPPSPATRQGPRPPASRRRRKTVYVVEDGWPPDSCHVTYGSAFTAKDDAANGSSATASSISWRRRKISDHGVPAEAPRPHVKGIQTSAAKKTAATAKWDDESDPSREARTYARSDRRATKPAPAQPSQSTPRRHCGTTSPASSARLPFYSIPASPATSSASKYRGRPRSD